MTAPWIAAYCALAVGFVVLAVVTLGALRQFTGVLELVVSRLEVAPAEAAGVSGLPSGTKVRAFQVSTASGEIFSEADLVGRRTIVLFLSGSCAPCHAVARDLQGSPHDLDELVDRLYIAVPEPADAKALALPNESAVVYQPRRELANVLGSTVTPQAFMIDADGRIEHSAFVNGWESLRAMAERRSVQSTADAHELASL